MKVKQYAPNSVRVEVDDDVARKVIYIRDELYEICPLQATMEECEMRLHDIMNELGIEGDTESTYLDIN